MKKILSSLVCVGLIMAGSISVANAENQFIEGQDKVSQNAIDVGNEYARQMEEKSRMTRMDEEVWTLYKTDPLIGYNTIKASLGEMLPVGQSITKTMSWSLGIGVPIGNTGVSLTASIGATKTVKYSGPNSSDKLVNGLKANKRAFFLIAKGSVNKYYYKITNKYGGGTTRYATKTLAANVVYDDYSQDINVTGNTVTMENSTGKKVKSTTLANYKAQFNKTGAQADDMYFF